MLRVRKIYLKKYLLTSATSSRKCALYVRNHAHLRSVGASRRGSAGTRELCKGRVEHRSFSQETGRQTATATFGL